MEIYEMNINGRGPGTSLVGEPAQWDSLTYGDGLAMPRTDGGGAQHVHDYGLTRQLYAAGHDFELAHALLE